MSEEQREGEGRGKGEGREREGSVSWLDTVDMLDNRCAVCGCLPVRAVVTCLFGKRRCPLHLRDFILPN